MKTILLILGSETGEFAGGRYNRGLFDTAEETLSENYKILKTVVEEGYDPQQEIEKWKQADHIIYQYPVYWFMMPALLKKYLDDVYAYGEFFSFTDGAYGSGGLMSGKSVMLSTTWNAPDDAFGSAFFDGGDRDAVLLPMRKSQTYCGLDELPHFSVHDVVKNPNFEKDQECYRDHLKATFNL